MSCDGSAVSCGFLMKRMISVRIERLAIAIDSYKTRVVRAVEMKNITADVETNHIGNHIRKISEFCDVLFAFGNGGFRLVFPTNNMCQHKPYFGTKQKTIAN